MHNLFSQNFISTQSSPLRTRMRCQISARNITQIFLLVLLCSVNIGQSAIVPSQRQQDLDNGRIKESDDIKFQLTNIPESILQVEPLDNFDNENDDNLEENLMQKRNYQHIWRNVQMRMPVYSTNGMARISGAKRSLAEQNQVLRHRANTLYRLG